MDPRKIKIWGIAQTQEVRLNGVVLDLAKSQKVRNHSLDGFAWGYGGSGPAQLALAIMLEIFPEETAVRNYQFFKQDFIAGLPLGEDFERTIFIGQWAETYGIDGLLFADKVTKPELAIVGTDGNAFNLLAKARKVALRNGLDWESIKGEATSGDYNKLLQVLMKHFEIV